MNKNKKLEAFAAREIGNLKNQLIESDGRGGILAFGKYKITTDKSQYTVEIKNQYPLTFGSKRSAMSWCIADQHNQHALARNILLLDNKKHMLSADIYCRQTIADRSKHEDFYESVVMKIQSKIDYVLVLETELEKCVNSAKYIQIRGFLNETERTGRTASHTTNR
jgi:hypothetical protein